MVSVGIDDSSVATILATPDVQVFGDALRRYGADIDVVVSLVVNHAVRCWLLDGARIKVTGEHMAAVAHDLS